MRRRRHDIPRPPASTWRAHLQRACSQRTKSHSESCFGSRSASWLGSRIELRVLTSVVNAVPITNTICALRGNILFLLRSPRWWPIHGFSAHFQKMHTHESRSGPKNQAFSRRGSRSKTHFFLVLKAHFKSLIWKSFAFTKGKIRLSNQERVRITFQNGFRNAIRSFVNRPCIASHPWIWFTLFFPP